MDEEIIEYFGYELSFLIWVSLAFILKKHPSLPFEIPCQYSWLFSVTKKLTENPVNFSTLSSFLQSHSLLAILIGMFIDIELIFQFFTCNVNTIFDGSNRNP